jgi:hypothetical protein
VVLFSQQAKHAGTLTPRCAAKLRDVGT